MRLRVGIGAILALFVGVAGLWWVAGNSGLSRAKAQTTPSDVPIPVVAGVVTDRNVPQYLEGIGTVQAYNTVTVESRVDGDIVRVGFREGQEVKKGTLLFQIDPRPYQAALEQAQAQKAKDEAQLTTAEADLARYAKLVGRGYQTQQSYDQQKGLVAQDKAAIQGDQAQVDTAKLNLGYTEIRSPIDGRLGTRLVDIGNLVRAANNTPLVTITQMKPIFVSFTLPQDTLDEIRHYQSKGRLEVLAYSGDDKKELARGKLTVINNMVNQTTGTILLKASFTNDNERLWPGEFVNARLILRIRRGATVPSQTVQKGPSGDFVYVIRPNNTVERRPVTVAAVQDGLAVTTNGLKPGERVVVNGQYRLTEGARVRLVPASKMGSTS